MATAQILWGWLQRALGWWVLERRRVTYRDGRVETACCGGEACLSGTSRGTSGWARAYTGIINSGYL